MEIVGGGKVHVFAPADERPHPPSVSSSGSNVSKEWIIRARGARASSHRI